MVTRSRKRHTIYEFRQLIKRAGVPLNDSQIKKLWQYHILLRKADRDLNLIRTKNFENLILKHYVDSLMVITLLKNRLPSPLLDIGTGPGLPGIILKIASPDTKVILGESRKNKVNFLNKVIKELGLSNIEIFPHIVTASFPHKVKGVITRAVEDISTTLKRSVSFLEEGGMVIFMKGPSSEDELLKAKLSFLHKYLLILNKDYILPGSEIKRKIVVFKKRASEIKGAIEETLRGKKFLVRHIKSKDNLLFKRFSKLLTSKGIKRYNEVLISGRKIIEEILIDHPSLIKGLIVTSREVVWPHPLIEKMLIIHLDYDLFKRIDIFGTNSPILWAEVPDIHTWKPKDYLKDKSYLLLPFQDPENIGTVIRSSVAMGLRDIVLLREAANPFLPKSIRASGSTIFKANLYKGPSIQELPPELPIITLSPEGKALTTFKFPRNFLLLPGIEGPGLPSRFRRDSISIPMEKDVDSLNAATATAIALYKWRTEKASQTE